MSSESSQVESARFEARTYLVRSLVLYALILGVVEYAARVSYRATLPQLHYLSPARAYALVEAHLAADLVFRVAFLSLPLLTAVLLARFSAADPLGDLGLRGWRVVRDLVIGLALGGLAYHAVWLGMAALSGTPSAWGGFFLWLAEESEYWREPKGLALVALGLCYAMGRLIVPLGHCPRRAEVAWGGKLAAALGALVFALPHLASVYVSPLCLLNLLLAGWAMTLLRLRGGTMGLPLGLLAGWTAVEHMADLALSDSSLEQAYASSLPALLSGGFSGVSGSLLLTMALCGWLAWLLRPPRSASEEVRPEGFEPPAP